MIDMLNQLGQTWMGYFALALVQNTVFLLLVFAALAFARNASAHIRHVICLVGILKLLVPPFLPAAFLAERAPAASIPGSPGPSAPFIAGAAGGVAAAARETIARPDTAGALLAIWIAVVIVIVLASVVSTFRLSFSLRGAIPVPEATDEIPHGSGIRILKSDRVSMPITVGVFPNRIYVPTTWDAWSEECRRTVIRHEIAHIKRFDGLVQVFQILAQAFYFFHPLVWLLNRRLACYREMACDDLSVGSGRYSRLQYSRNLVEVAETVARDPFACESVSAFMRRKNELLTRIRYQLKEGIMHGASKTRMAVVLTALIFAVLPLSWYQSAATPDESGAAPQGTSPNVNKTFVDVSVNSADLILVNGNKTNLDNFAKDLAKEASGKDGTVIINMSCDNELPMGVLFKVQQTMVGMGLNKINYESDLAAAMPLVLPNGDALKRLESIPDEDIALIHLKESGLVFFDNEEVEVGKLHDIVKKHVTQNDKLIVRINIDKAATYNDFAQVLHEVKLGDARRIVIE